MRAIAWVWTSFVGATIALPATVRAADPPARPNPAAFLLPPVAAPSSAGNSGTSGNSASRDDLPASPREPGGIREPAPLREPTPVRESALPRESAASQDDRIVPFAPIREKRETLSEERPRPRDPEVSRNSGTAGVTLAPPRDIMPVSAQAIEDSRNAGERERKTEKPVDLIDYLSGRNDFAPTARKTPASRTSDRSAGRFGDRVIDAVDAGGGGHKWFQSDHCFDAFVSPMTNPFLFEDPRSTTEIRPIFIYQRVPSREPVFQGGNITFLGVQGRVAITERWSFVMNKLGGIGVNPNSAFLSDETGFAEIWLGPKYTFLRDQDSRSVAAGGLTFQIPAGSSSVRQDTGTLSLVPYVSYAQNFWDTQFGSFNGILGTGYSFSVNNERSDYYYLSAHLDFDVMNRHRFYPLLELNWFYNTTNGNQSPYRFEGRDLVNFGSQGKGSNLLTGAIGTRVKITQNIETGFGFEIPLAGNRDLFQYRWTVDLIWRF